MIRFLLVIALLLGCSAVYAQEATPQAEKQDYYVWIEQHLGECKQCQDAKACKPSAMACVDTQNKFTTYYISRALNIQENELVLEPYASCGVTPAELEESSDCKYLAFVKSCPCNLTMKLLTKEQLTGIIGKYEELHWVDHILVFKQNEKPVAFLVEITQEHMDALVQQQMLEQAAEEQNKK